MDKVIVITGCSAGIGEFTAKELLDKGATVIFACRDEKKTLTIIDSLPDNLRKKAIFLKLDLTSFESVRSFVKQFSNLNLTIDIIINNAGVIMNTYERTKDNIETTFQSNHLSHMYMTVLLLKHLSKNNGRIINVSSNVHTLVKSIDIESLEKDTQFLNSRLHTKHIFHYKFIRILRKE
jgi:NAD(P)-dependent dehydrogenase (short-subunit alcohol dehydrogenase family)